MGKKRRRKLQKKHPAATTSPSATAHTPENKLDIGIADDVIFPDDKSGVSREVRNIIILMTSLIAVVIVVILVDRQNSFIAQVGQQFMKWLHIWGA